MSEWFETWRIEQFSSNVEMLLQDQGGKLRNCVSVKAGYRGKGARPVKQWGESEANEVTERKGDTPDNAVPTDARWIYPSSIDWGHLIDEFDELMVDTSPQSEMVMAGVNAIRRKEDNKILQSFFAAAMTGESGGTSTAWDTANTVATSVGGSNTGLNQAKIRGGLEKLMGNEADPFGPDQVYMAIGEAEWNALFGETTTTSKDFISGSPIETGKLPNLYGVNFVPFSESRLTANGLTSTNALDLPMWIKSGMHFGIWADRQVDILKRDDKKGAPHPYIKQTVGVTRTQEPKVVKIKCYRA